MIRVHTRDDVAVLELGHGKANALDLELCRRFGGLLDELGGGPATALVLTGRSGIFSAGVDLLRLLREGPEYIDRLLPALRDLLETLFTFPKPVVAAMNGHAIAGGCVVACAADHRMMAGGAGRVGVPELRVGVPFPSAALEIMRFALPREHFREIMYRGAVLDPEAALEWGLIDEIVPPEELLDRAVASARDLATAPVAAFTLTKKRIREPSFERMKTGRDEHDPAVREVWLAPETREAIRGYVSRTFKPDGS